MKNKRNLYTPLGFRQMPRNDQDNGSLVENPNVKSIFKKNYPLIYLGRIAISLLNNGTQALLWPSWDRDNARWKFKKFTASRASRINSTKKIISNNKSPILNLVIKKKHQIMLLLKKKSIPKKIHQLNRCFFLKKKPSITNACKNDTVFFNFHLKNFHKSLKHEFTPYYIQSTIRLKNNKQLASIIGLVIKRNSYNSKKVKNKNFLLIRRPRFIKSKLINETLSLKQYSPNTQQTTHISYYTTPINSLFKPNNSYKKPKKPAPSTYSCHSLVKKKCMLLINNKKFTRALVKLSPISSYKTRINSAISKVNGGGFPNPTEKILRLKTRIQHQSNCTLEKTYELLNTKTLAEKEIVILNKQIFDIKKDTEALLQFSKKILMSNKPSIVKTYTYDFL